MGHNLDINEGVASYADSRRAANGKTDAWHQLGQTIGRTMTPAEALEAANMANWNVRKLPLVADVAEGEGSPPVMVPVEGRFAVVRDNPVTGRVDSLGVVGNRWQPYQNEETTDLLYDITDQSGAHIETIGELDGGRQTFVTMKMPGYMEFTNADRTFRDITDLYLAVFNHHDGGGSLRSVISPVRVVCANTQRLAEGMAVSTVSLRHTGSPTAKLQEVRDLLGVTFAYQDAYAAAMESLIAKERDDEFVRGVLNDVFGVGAADSERTRTGRIERVTQVMELYRSDSPTTAPFRGTAYGAVNAVTEYMDHFAPIQRRRGDAASRRAVRTLMSPDIAAIKSRAVAAFAAA